MTVEQEPTLKRMGYDVRCYLVGVVGYLELLQDEETTSADKQKCIEKATKQARRALELSEGMFKAICVVDPNPIEW
jgi:hypothetical protein